MGRKTADESIRPADQTVKEVHDSLFSKARQPLQPPLHTLPILLGNIVNAINIYENPGGGSQDALNRLKYKIDHAMLLKRILELMIEKNQVPKATADVGVQVQPPNHSAMEIQGPIAVKRRYEQSNAPCERNKKPRTDPVESDAKLLHLCQQRDQLVSVRRDIEVRITALQLELDGNVNEIGKVENELANSAGPQRLEDLRQQCAQFYSVRREMEAKLKKLQDELDGNDAQYDEVESEIAVATAGVKPNTSGDGGQQEADGDPTNYWVNADQPVEACGFDMNPLGAWSDFADTDLEPKASTLISSQPKRANTAGRRADLDPREDRSSISLIAGDRGGNRPITGVSSPSTVDRGAIRARRYSTARCGNLTNERLFDEQTRQILDQPRNHMLDAQMTGGAAGGGLFQESAVRSRTVPGVPVFDEYGDQVATVGGEQLVNGEGLNQPMASTSKKSPPEEESALDTSGESLDLISQELFDALDALYPKNTPF